MLRCNNTAWVLDQWGFNIHVDDPSERQAIAFLSMLHDTNLTQHVNFPTHDPGSHTLDLVITSTYSSLNPAVTRANMQPSDHFPVFYFFPNLPPPPPQSYIFRRLNSIDHTSFLDDVKQSSLITNPPQLLNPCTFGWIRHYLHTLLDACTRHYQTIYSPQSFSAMVHWIHSYCSSRLSSSRIYLQIQTFLFRPFYLHQSSQSIS